MVKKIDYFGDDDDDDVDDSVPDNVKGQSSSDICYENDLLISDNLDTPSFFFSSVPSIALPLILILDSCH